MSTEPTGDAPDPAVGGDPSAGQEPTPEVADPVDAGAAGDGAPAEGPPASVEELVVDLERVTAERDGYLDQLRRTQADFENARKRLQRLAEESAASAAERFAETLLPVLDACESALEHGAEEVRPIFSALMDTLEREGLAPVPGAGEPFDPNVHEAVMHEPAEDGDDGTVVVEVLRSGYTWKERTIRASMVKVRG